MSNISFIVSCKIYFRTSVFSTIISKTTIKVLTNDWHLKISKSEAIKKKIKVNLGTLIVPKETNSK